MSSLLIAMTLLGCSDAGDQCRDVRVLPARYATVAACNAAAEDALTRNIEISAPVMAVRCVSAPPIVLASAR